MLYAAAKGRSGRPARADGRKYRVREYFAFQRKSRAMLSFQILIISGKAMTSGRAARLMGI